MRLRNEVLLARYRVMVTEAGIFPETVTDAQLLETVRGESYQDKLAGLEKLLSLFSSGFWEKRGV